MSQERTDEEILAALERWLKRVDNPNDVMIGFSIKHGGRKTYTFAETLQEVRNKTEFGRKLLAKLKRISENHGIDVIKFIDNAK